MNEQEFYDYIVKNFTLDGTSCRLINNIINYVAAQGFTDDEDNFAAISHLLDGAFGIEKHELNQFKPQS